MARFLSTPAYRRLGLWRPPVPWRVAAGCALATTAVAAAPRALALGRAALVRVAALLCGRTG
ncbi:MAG TPA: hypothetical protein VNL77_01360, partial [Roseiflexaceae bacterium]|nr:hypothetical protein [Roseiflexaceae bacterium]